MGRGVVFIEAVVKRGEFDAGGMNGITFAHTGVMSIESGDKVAGNAP